MTEGKHTPGPWNIYPPYEDGDKGCLVRARSCSIAEVIPHANATEPNARLIAAAPEMAEALQSMLRYCKAAYRNLRGTAEDADYREELANLIKPARMALNKAGLLPEEK
jgi:hypothetical protein